MTDHNYNREPRGHRPIDALLDRGLSNRLTLILGPTDDDQAQALADWIEDRSIVAISIRRTHGDDGANCLGRIIGAFVNAGLVDDDQLDEALTESDQSALIALINQLSTIDREIVIILENYAPSKASDSIISFLLEHLPNQLHLYLCCEDPPPLSCIPRLRVRRQLQTIDTSEM